MTDTVGHESRANRWLGAAAGVVSAGLALGIAELVAALSGPNSAPLVAVGGLVIDHVPGPVKDFATTTFGTHDKTALIIGTTVLLLAFAAVVGHLALTRSKWYGVAGITLFGLVGVVSALSRAGAGVTYVLPSMVGAAAAGVALDFLLRRVRPTPEPPAERRGRDAKPAWRGTPAEARRKFLTESAAIVIGAAIVGYVGRQIGERRNVSAARNEVKLPAPSEAASPLPGGVDLGQPDVTPFVTGNGNFYRIDTALAIPQVNPDSWTLTIHGRVTRPMTLTYAQLLARPMIERYITLACVSNEVGGDLIGNAKWLGVRVKDLLEEAGPLPGADQVVGRSVDGFTVGTPTSVLLDGRDAMLAVGMNGEPLPVPHGFPVRMVVPGLYGYVSATKWISELELSSFADYSAYWVPRGWSAQAPIKTESRIDTPRDGARVRVGQLTVAGVAWAQHRGISKVEVRVDDGPWQPATLGAVPSVDTWRQWSWSWTTTPGDHRLSVRATDNAGATQTEDEAPPPPNGASGYHTIGVTAR
jgi:DMSO/TMAO reductase YedYZ molybdopterin-dependent catalytic subunit